MTLLSTDSGFNAIVEVKSSVAEDFTDAWTVAYITFMRRNAREVIPDMPISVRDRVPKSTVSSNWKFVNAVRLAHGLTEIAENLHQTSYFDSVEDLPREVNINILDVIERVPLHAEVLQPSGPEGIQLAVPEVDLPEEVAISPVMVNESTPPPPSSNPVEVENIVNPEMPVSADLSRVDESSLEEHLTLEKESGDQLSFEPGYIVRDAVDYVISNGKVVMNYNVLKSELPDYILNEDDWKLSNTRKVVFGQAFGKLGYSPAPTSFISTLTERLRNKVITPATRQVDLSSFAEHLSDPEPVETKHITLPKFDTSITLNMFGETEKELKERIKEIGNSLSKERMSKMLSQIYGCDIEFLSFSRSSEKLVKGANLSHARLIEVKVKVFTKGDELVMKAKPRSIKFPVSWFWLCTVLALEKQLAAIKSDKYWSWRPDSDIPFRVYWASGMTQKQLSEAWSHAISNLPNHLGEKGEFFAFICGDDNSDELGAADASSYDSTQREFFAECQWRSMQSFERPILETLQKVHHGKRSGRGFSYFQKNMANPSGSPFTLFINTLGMAIYTCERARRRIDLQRMLNRTLNPEEYTRLSIEVGKAYGLEMTVTTAPELGNIGEGVEFLKGMWIWNPAVGSSESSRNNVPLIWVPLPSRLVKAGKIICDTNGTKVTPGMLNDQLVGVATSFKSAVVPPLLSDWIEVWKGKGKAVPMKSWQNILYVEDSDFLSIQGNAAFCLQAEKVVAHRYGWSREDLSVLRQIVRDNGRKFGVHHGALWERLSLTDYCGGNFNV